MGLLDKAKQLLTIDKDRLEEEWYEQPKLYLEFAEALADARRDAEEAKANLELVEAEMDQKIRLKPERYGLDKVTESALAKTVILQPEYQKAQRALIVANHTVNILLAATQAASQRKEALENAVKLFLNGFFAEPRAPRDVHEQLDHSRKEAIRSKGKART